MMEWWDQTIVDHPELVTNLVEHPVPLQGISGAKPKTAKPVEAMLIPAERKKLRKIRRQEKVKEMQDKVRMGLIAPPPPRVKIKNMMLVLGQEAVAGPSAIEQAVRTQVDQRLREHEERNEARKLDPETRRQKNIAKWTKPAETSQRLSISIFRVSEKINNKIKFKVCKNAEQLHLTGVFVHSFANSESDGIFYPSLIVVEGSKKSVKRFDRLLLHRIDWHEKVEPRDGTAIEMEDTSANVNDEVLEQDSDDDAIKEAGGGVCKRVFHGIDGDKSFYRWNYCNAKSIDELNVFLSQTNAHRYWDMINRYRDSKLDI